VLLARAVDLGAPLLRETEARPRARGEFTVAFQFARTYGVFEGGFQEPHMGKSDNHAVGRWLNEGGHDLSDHARADLLARIAAADRSELAALWSEAVAEWGDGASRLWQEALSAYDASET
jgi:hypothetical protein